MKRTPSWHTWVGGWCSLGDGVALVLSLGYYDPALRYHWAIRTMAARWVDTDELT